MLKAFDGARAICVAAGAAAALSISACKPADASNGAASPGPADAGGPVFLNPPQGTAARRAPGGGVDVAGRAPPGATVTLANPDGQSLSAKAAADGGWTVRAPASSQPRLYALSAAVPGRAFRSDGALLIAPEPAAAVLVLRAGASARTLSAADGALVLESVDFDSGGLAVAGLADPRASLRLSLDGRPAAAGQADAAGRFALLAVQGDLKPGAHRLKLEDGVRAIEAAFDATPATAVGPYAVRAISGGWRIDWSTPGGGVQSSILFAPPPAQGRR